MTPSHSPSHFPAWRSGRAAWPGATLATALRVGISILTAVVMTLPCSTDVKARDFETLNQEANAGDPAAQLSLAYAFRDGEGVDKDEAMAMQWAHRAADQGNADAKDFVGHAFLRGSSVRRSPEIAYGYFKAAAESSAQAAFNLGQCYFGAQGTAQDAAKAIEVWTHAAELGHGRAASTAAMALLAGEGVEPDPEEAKRLAERAAQLDDPSGLVLLGEMHYQAGGIDQARELWTRVAQTRPVGATGNPEQASADNAAQQGADLIRLIDYRQREPEPGRFALVEVPHVQQGYNNCGATACAMLARFQGQTIGGWDFKRLCPSPLGTGTDWSHLLEAAAELGLKWKLVTFTPDEAGFDQAATFLRAELDAGRPVLIDFKYYGPQYPGGEAGHTLGVNGYIADEDLYILFNPAVATPGLQLMTAADLERYWRSNYYSAKAHGIMARPAFAIEAE